jgi:8-oxo-dGTP diphosphatase
MNNQDDFQLEFYSLKSNQTRYNYVVIVSFYKGDLLWVRQKGRNTWEIPGGHVELGETPEEAAERELVEETGATSYTILPICDFGLFTKNGSSYNRLYMANVEILNPVLESEIEEVKVFVQYPKRLTHGTIQLKLIEEVKRKIQN